jgi:peptidoglycan/xylan/chitin deacetylase (PgdA/CDA1 family)
MGAQVVGTRQVDKRKQARLWIGVAIACVALLFLNKLRLDVGGVHNLFSPSYWSSRLSGAEHFNPSTRYLKSGNPAYKEVCFTFDDGPHPASCQRILNVLKANDVHATFFLVGLRIKQRPDLARAILADGNEVGNHTMHHPRLDTLTPDKVRQEMEDCETTFEKATNGSHMYLFRPPGERMDKAVLDTALQMNYVTVGWQIGAKDYTGSGADSELVEYYVLKQLKPGAIILLHDNPITAAVLPDMIKQIKAQGYRTVMVSQLLSHLPNPVYIQTNAHQS